jgi:hypothetical protein
MSTTQVWLGPTIRQGVALLLTVHSRALVRRFEELLRAGSVRLPLEFTEYEAFIRGDRWNAVAARGAPGPRR